MKMNKRPSFIIRPKRRRRFNWAIVAIPGAVLLAMWFASRISIGFSWDSLLTAWHIHDKERFTQLACLGVLCVAVCAIARLARKRQPEEEDKK